MDYNVRTQMRAAVWMCLCPRMFFKYPSQNVQNILVVRNFIYWTNSSLHAVLSSDDKALIYINSVRMDVTITIVVMVIINPKG